MSGKQVLFRLTLLCLLILVTGAVSKVHRSFQEEKVSEKKDIFLSLKISHDDVFAFQFRKPSYDRYGVLGAPILEKSNIEITPLYNIGFVSGFSDKLRTSLWSASRIEGEIYTGEYKRFETWIEDRNISVDAYDFESTGIQRGHLIRSYDMYRCYGPLAMVQSFRMTNAAAMIPGFNTGIWADSENQILNSKKLRSQKSLASEDMEVWQICGPIFENEVQIIGDEIPLAKAFYKILVRDENNRVYDFDSKFMAFIFPHTDDVQGDLEDFLVSIDEVESATGLNFFPELNDENESRIESSLAESLWK